MKYINNNAITGPSGIGAGIYVENTTTEIDMSEVNYNKGKIGSGVYISSAYLPPAPMVLVAGSIIH